MEKLFFSVNHAIWANNKFLCTSCHLQGHVGCKIFLEQNLPVLDWGCRLTRVVLYNGRKTVVVVVTVSDWAVCHSVIVVLSNDLCMHMFRHWPSYLEFDTFENFQLEKLSHQLFAVTFSAVATGYL